MLRLIACCLIALIAPIALAEHVATYGNTMLSDEVDEFTGNRRISTMAMGRPGSTQVLLICRIVPSTDVKSLSLGFGVDEPIAAPGSDVIIYLRVDQNEPIGGLYAQMFPTSYEGAFMMVQGKLTHDLIAQMKAGDTLKVRFQGTINIVEYAVSLSGFTKASAAVLKACDYKKP